MNSLTRGKTGNAILVTGGAGFIGSNFVIQWLTHTAGHVVNLDKLTYAGNMENLAALSGNQRHVFVQGDICDSQLLGSLFNQHKPTAVVHFAAESHVDRSIHGPSEFINTNIHGTFVLLEAVRNYVREAGSELAKQFRFLHVSTDEVYGSLEGNDPPFTETTPYKPKSPYSASKAASAHLVRAYHHTYGIPTVTTNCSNNYGPYQFPEKLIPLMIATALEGKPLPIYDDGLNVRDWLYVSDHCSAIRCVLERGELGETYNVGGMSERSNLEVVRTLCNLLDELKPRSDGRLYAQQITYVRDRPGHDRRYAIDPCKIMRELGWRSRETFETGIRKTVRWYLANSHWVAHVKTGTYREWIARNYR